MAIPRNMGRTHRIIYLVLGVGTLAAALVGPIPNLSIALLLGSVGVAGIVSGYSGF